MVVLSSHLHGIETDFATVPLKNIMSVNKWTKYDVSFNDTIFLVYKNGEKVMEYQPKKPILGYWYCIIVFNQSNLTILLAKVRSCSRSRLGYLVGQLRAARFGRSTARWRLVSLVALDMHCILRWRRGVSY